MMNINFAQEWNEKKRDYTGLPHQASGTVKCIRCTKEVSQAGNPMYVWLWRVKTGAYQGQEIKEFTALTPKALWKLKQILEAIYATKVAGPFDFDDEDILGMSCRADMRISVYEGQERIEIVKYQSIESN